jgi:hypothetical protein
MRNLSGKIYVAMIISCFALMISGCGAQDTGSDIAPIKPKAEAVSATATPTLSAEIAGPVSPVSPVSPPKEGSMSKTGTVEPIQGSEDALAAAVANLAEKSGVAPAEITLVSMEAVEWNDASLGCPQEGFMYAQVITPGYLIMLEAGGQEYAYHTDQQGKNIVLCENK